MRDMENRCPIGNRKIDGLKEVKHGDRPNRY